MKKIKVSDSPQIVLVENFLTQEECEKLIDLARPRMKPSTVVSPKDGKAVRGQYRTSSTGVFKRGETEFISIIENKIAELTNWPIDRGEDLNVTNYQIGQEYRAHYDSFDPTKPGHEKALKRSGQRFATVILYLNSPKQGGSTSFPKLNLEIGAQQGNALFFSSVDENLNLDSKSLHAGMPVIEGEKWIATKWLREKTF